MNLEESFEQESWEEVHFHDHVTIGSLHLQSLMLGMPCQLSLMLSGRSHVQTPASENKQAGYIWTLLYFLSSSLCGCRRCYFQPCLINMCHIRCEKYSQRAFMPFDTLAIIQGNWHHFFRVHLSEIIKIWWIIQSDSLFKCSLQSFNWTPFHT